jgi:internalin A
VSPELQVQAPEQEQAINLIKKMGGQVQRDPKAPGQPAIGISLRGTHVTDADLESLKQLKSLQILNLSQTAITDAGLKPIASLPNLRNLILPVSITDAGLVHLKGLRNLKILLLNGTKVTDAGLRDIQQALPRARISR